MKNLKITGLLVLGLLFATITSCDKDDENPSNPSNPSNPTDYSFEVGAAKTASFFGTIIDENSNAVAGADISIGNKSTTTNAEGIFFVEDASVYENLAYIKAEKDGYFLGSRSVVPTDGVNTVRIMLLDKEQIGSFDASTGGSVSGNGITIDFAAGIVDANGDEYTGNVNVAAKYIDPESDDFADYMPGNLIGANEDGGNYLESYGMVAVELTDGAGNELQLADESPAEISFPLSAALQGTAPASIPLWSFDEDRGYWIEEGSATLEGGVYKGEVAHFSFWNCDIPTDYVIIEGQVVDTAGTGVSGVVVKIVSTGFGTGTAFLDDSGEYGGIVPANDNLTIKVLFDCGTGYEEIYSEVLGSFSSDAIIPTIEVEAASGVVNLVGTIVDCDNNPVANGYLNYNGNSTYLSGGNFSVFGCDGSDIDIQGFDIDNLTQSGVLTYTLSGGLLDVGQIVACDDITEYIYYNLDGVDYYILSDFQVSEQGSYIGISGNDLTYLSFSSQSFTGVGSYIIADTSGQNYFSLYDGGPGEYYSDDLTFNLTQWGGNTGELIEADFTGFVMSYATQTPTPLPITGNVNFFRD